MARPRRALHRAFAHFLAANDHRFKGPILPRHRTDRLWTFAFPGITDAISGSIGTCDITVWITWTDQDWDCILDLDVTPTRISSGVECNLCEPGKRILFADRKTLWTDHLFEPLLEWVNGTLASARYLVLTGQIGDLTMARLKAERPNIEPTASRPTVVVSLRTGSLDGSSDA